jgi:hypothetical protein
MGFFLFANLLHNAGYDTDGFQILHIILGLIFNFDVSCDQNRGIEPLFCTTELTSAGPGTASHTICSVSTSFATRPFSFTPLFKYLLSIH